MLSQPPSRAQCLKSFDSACAKFATEQSRLDNYDGIFDYKMVNYCSANPTDITCSCNSNENGSLDPFNRVFTNSAKCWKQSCKDRGYQSLAQKRTKCASKSVVCSNVADITGGDAAEINQYCGTKPPEEIVIVDYNLIIFIVIICLILSIAITIVLYRLNNKV